MSMYLVLVSLVLCVCQRAAVGLSAAGLSSSILLAGSAVGAYVRGLVTLLRWRVPGVAPHGGR